MPIREALMTDDEQRVVWDDGHPQQAKPWENVHAERLLGDIICERDRLKALYENAVGNRERFGWTINHLLECEEALRTVEERATVLEEALRGLMSEAKAWLEPAGARANPAMHKARRALDG